VRSRGFKIYALCFFISLFALSYAHFFLQNYLFMRPCEQCVYIRFAMSVIILGAVLGILSEFFKNHFLSFLALLMLFLGVILGFYHSFLLAEIYKALEESNPFGISGCSNQARFIFSLSLDEYFPKLFKPSGICGLESAFVSEGANLSSLQEFFIGTRSDDFSSGIYSKGWFLIPGANLINMAQACFVLFGVLSLCVLFLSFHFFKNKQFLIPLFALSGGILIFIFA